MNKFVETESFLSVPIKRLFSNRPRLTLGLSNSVKEKTEARDQEIPTNIEAITTWNKQILCRLTPFEIKNIQESHGSPQWYMDYIQVIHPILTGFWHYIWLLESKECLSISFKWREYEYEFNTVIRGVNLESDICDHYVSLLIVTALSERILGNAFLIEGKNVPFLLRDLLDTCELKKLLGDPLVDFLKVLMGSVNGLNLRNIAWHGFLSPSDVRPEHVAAIVNALYLCQNQLTLSNKNLVYRSHLCLHQIFTRLENNYKSIAISYDDALKIIYSSSLVLPVMRPYWNKALNLVLDRKKEALVLILPLLENSLRILYATVNNCSSSCIFATNDSTFYITLEEILSPFVDSLALKKTSKQNLKTGSNLRENCEFKNNFVPQMLGRQLTEAFYDLFQFISGPRIRDRISHGEVLFQNIPPKVIDLLFNLCLLVVSVERWRFDKDFENLFTISCQCQRFENEQFCSNHYSSKIMNINIEVLKQCYISKSKYSLLSNLVSNITSYESCFHPLSFLKTSYIEVITYLNKWKTWDHPICKDNDWENFSQKYLSLKLNYSCFVKSCLLPTTFTVMPLRELLVVVQSFSPTILFTAKKELELIKILQKIINSAQISARNIHVSLEKNMQLFISKSFRSRQRDNYKRQLDIIPHIVDNINFNLNVLVMIFINIDHIPFIQESQISSLVKILKNVLKNFENLLSFTNESVNKYQESLLILEDNSFRLNNYFINFEDAIQCPDT